MHPHGPPVLNLALHLDEDSLGQPRSSSRRAPSLGRDALEPPSLTTVRGNSLKAERAERSRPRRASLAGTCARPAAIFEPPPAPRQRLCRIGLRSVVLPFIFLILAAACTSIGLLSSDAANKNSTELRDQILFHVGRRVQENVLLLFNSGSLASAQMARGLATEQRHALPARAGPPAHPSPPGSGPVAPHAVSAADLPRAIGAARAMASAFRFRSIAFILPDGAGFILRRESSGSIFRPSGPAPLEPYTISETAVNATTGALDRWSYYYAADRRPIELSRVYSDTYDPRERPFWRAGVSARAGSWTDVYPLTAGSAGISFSLPLFGGGDPLDGSGGAPLMGVVAATLDLRLLSSYLAYLGVGGHEGTSGFAAVLARDERNETFVVAYHRPEAFLQAQFGSGREQMVSAGQLGDPLLRAFVAALPPGAWGGPAWDPTSSGGATASEAASEAAASAVRFDDGGGRSYSGRYLATSVGAGPGQARGRPLRLLVGVALEDAAVHGRVATAARTTAGIAAGAMLCVVALMGAVSWEIGRQLRAFHVEVAAVTSLRLASDNFRCLRPASSVRRLSRRVADILAGRGPGLTLPQATPRRAPLLGSFLVELDTFSRELVKMRSLLAIISGMLDAIIVCDERGRVSMLNSRALELFGIGRPEAVQGAQLGPELIAPADRAVFEAFLAAEVLERTGRASEFLACRRVRAPPPPRSSPAPPAHAAAQDGARLFPAEFSVGHTLLSGAPQLVVCVRDISERRALLTTVDAAEGRAAQLQRDLEHALACSASPAFAVDAAACLTEWSPAMEALTGRPAEEALGAPLHSLLAPPPPAPGPTSSTRAPRRAGAGAARRAPPDGAGRRLVARGDAEEAADVPLAFATAAGAEAALTVQAAARCAGSGARTGLLCVSRETAEAAALAALRASARAKARALAPLLPPAAPDEAAVYARLEAGLESPRGPAECPSATPSRPPPAPTPRRRRPRPRARLLRLAGNAVRFTAAGSVSIWCEPGAGPAPRVEVAVADTGAGLGAREVARLNGPDDDALLWEAPTGTLASGGADAGAGGPTWRCSSRSSSGRGPPPRARRPGPPSACASPRGPRGAAPRYLPPVRVLVATDWVRVHVGGVGGAGAGAAGVGGAGPYDALLVDESLPEGAAVGPAPPAPPGALPLAPPPRDIVEGPASTRLAEAAARASRPAPLPCSAGRRSGRRRARAAGWLRGAAEAARPRRAPRRARRLRPCAAPAHAPAQFLRGASRAKAAAAAAAAAGSRRSTPPRAGSVSSSARGGAAGRAAASPARLVSLHGEEASPRAIEEAASELFV
eukprot:tig00020848_g14572.t1